MATQHRQVTASLFRVLGGIFAVLLFVVGNQITDRLGFVDVEKIRKLERIPPTSVIGSVRGEVQLVGYARSKDGRYLQSPVTRNDVVYYRHIVEQYDSNKDAWVRTTDVENMLDFFLEDSSGKALLLARTGYGGVDWVLEPAFVDDKLSRRVIEYRVDKDEKITAYGWLTENEPYPLVDFLTPGEHLPIVSTLPDDKIRGRLSAATILWIWAGASCFVFMSYGIFLAFGWHQSVRFLLLLAFCVSGLFGSYGVRSLEFDLRVGFDRVLVQEQKAELALRRIFSDLGVKYADPKLATQYPGLQVPFDLNEPIFDQLSRYEKTRINTLRTTAYEVRYRYMQQIDRFPENLYALAMGLNNPPPVMMPADQQQLADSWADNFVHTRTQGSVWLTLLALVFVVIFMWGSVRLIKVKRMQENLPSVKATGVTFGTVELKGRIQAEDESKLLIAPISKKPCVWYHYEFTEHSDNDTNITQHRIKKIPFLCADEEGEVRVFPSKATIHSNKAAFRNTNQHQTKERRLDVGDPVYLLGYAKPDRTKADSLVIKHEEGNPYIISNMTEEEVMFINAGWGLLLMSIGISLLYLVMLWIGASGGNLTSLDFVLLAGIGPFLLFGQIIVLMYNDLIFLRERCSRDWANIQVSLKKRSNLVPRLQDVVRAYIKHEKDLMRRLTRLRRGLAEVEDASKVDEIMRLEHEVLDALLIAIENYPELKSDETARDFTRRLIRLENEVAMIRAGYNEAVTLYNIRCKSFPDNIIARMFGFNRLQRLRFIDTAHPIAYS